jgi:hypothetical protein
MTRHPYKTNVIWTLVLCLAIVTVVGCANEMALLRPGMVKTFSVQNADYDTAYTQAVLTAKELNFTIGLDDKAKGRITSQRGYGYGEMSYLWMEVKKDPLGKVTITLDVKSSGGSEGIITEFIGAYNKRVTTA